MITRILVVEDDPTLAASISRDLRLQAHDVVIAHSVEEAVRALGKAEFDVLLTDLRMTGGDGIELLRRTRALPGAPAAILMSGVASARDYQTAVDLGAVRVLTKPFSSMELHSAIRQAVECGTGYHGTIHGLGLVDVLQAFHLCRRSVSLQLGGRREGVVHMREGEIVHAESGDRVGEVALGWLLDQVGGHMSTQALPEELPRTIHNPFEFVLLEAMRSLDEQARPPEVFDLMELTEGANVAAFPVAPRPEATPPPRAASPTNPDVVPARSATPTIPGIVAPPEPPRPAKPAPRPPSQSEMLHDVGRRLLAAGEPLALKVAVGVVISAHQAVPVRAQAGDEHWAAITDELVALLHTLTADLRGVLECANNTIATWVIWDKSADVAVVLGDVVRSLGHAAWLRATTVATVQRVFNEVVISARGTGPGGGVEPN